MCNFSVDFLFIVEKAAAAAEPRVLEYPAVQLSLLLDEVKSLQIQSSSIQ